MCVLGNKQSLLDIVEVSREFQLLKNICGRLIREFFLSSCCVSKTYVSRKNLYIIYVWLVVAGCCLILQLRGGHSWSWLQHPYSLNGTILQKPYLSFYRSVYMPYTLVSTFSDRVYIYTRIIWARSTLTSCQYSLYKQKIWWLQGLRVLFGW